MAIAEDPNGSQATEVPDPVGIAELTAAESGTGKAEAVKQRQSERPPARLRLSDAERRLLSDLFAIVSEHAADSAVEIDRERVQAAFVFAC
ncbi:MAG: hypothetical protein JWL67_1926, partial [Solirubrobacterales bacterium]|nr:hypothetical protein [Solirubrobacterales bacterium]